MFIYVYMQDMPLYTQRYIHTYIHTDTHYCKVHPQKASNRPPFWEPLPGRRPDLGGGPARLDLPPQRLKLHGSRSATVEEPDTPKGSAHIT